MQRVHAASVVALLVANVVTLRDRANEEFVGSNMGAYNAVTHIELAVARSDSMPTPLPASFAFGLLDKGKEALDRRLWCWAHALSHQRGTAGNGILCLGHERPVHRLLLLLGDVYSI